MDAESPIPRMESAGLGTAADSAAGGQNREYRALKKLLFKQGLQGLKVFVAGVPQPFKYHRFRVGDHGARLKHAS